MTTLTISLTPEMQAEIDTKPTSGGQVFAYAAFFSGGDPQQDAVWTQLNPNFTAAATTTVTLPDPFESGKVYLIVESTSSSSADLFVGGDSQQNTGAILDQGDMNQVNAQKYDFLFDSFELTLNGAGTSAASDVGNLTEINSFGLPMEAEVTYSGGGSATVGYNKDGSQIATQIANIHPSDTFAYPFSAGPLANSATDPRLVIAPEPAWLVRNRPFRTRSVRATGKVTSTASRPMLLREANTKSL